MRKYSYKIVILIILFTLPLTACGIKPKNLDAPQGYEKEQFPKTYPSK